MSTLSKPEILRHLHAGNIVIDPFHEKNLVNTSYDVRLGKFYFRQKHLDHIETLNPFDENSLRKLYSDVSEAIPVSQIRSLDNPFYGFHEGDLVILIAPNETILAHTIEFIGGRGGIPGVCRAVTAEMRARSSVGRIGIAVCKCAGWGDIGYINRWTMEITNFSTAVIPLPVGMRIAQIIFREVEPVEEKDLYHTSTGKYQTTLDLEEIKKSWKPEDMLPKLYQDPDLGHFQEYYW